MESLKFLCDISLQVWLCKFTVICALKQSIFSLKFFLVCCSSVLEDCEVRIRPILTSEEYDEEDGVKVFRVTTAVN